MRVRVVLAATIVTVIGLASVAYYHWLTAGRAEMREATERVAAAVARGDRETLANDPLLQSRAVTVDWLLEHSPALARGYKVVAVCRNGRNGHYLMPQIATHLGEVKTSSGTLTLGFRYDRSCGRLELVNASSSTWPPR